MSYTMYVPTKTIFGAGKLQELHMQPLPGKKPLLVISNGKSIRENGAFDTVNQELARAGMQAVVFDKVQANPIKKTVMEGAKQAKEQGCDFVVALGGGSVLDCAKAIALMSTNEGDYWDYIGTGTGKGKPVQNHPLPLVAIPTTSGTGSEEDAACVITNEDTNEKTGFGNPGLFPALSIIDPDLTKTIPAKFTAYHENLPHGAGLIMISKAYYERFIEVHVCDERFIRMAKTMGKTDAAKPEDFIEALTDLQKQCGVDNLSVSEHGITEDEFPKMAQNAFGTMGRLFQNDRDPLSMEDCVQIYKKSFR